MWKHWGYRLSLFFIILWSKMNLTTCLGAANVTLGCFPEERLALLKFKRSLTDRFGMLSSWVGRDCCQWEQVGCDSSTGHVVKLDLRGLFSMFYPEETYYLVGNGEVNSALGELKHLTYLDLSMNRFGRGKIPKFIGSLKQLRYLNLSNAHFEGIIPHYLGNLSKLISLDLSYNINLILNGVVRLIVDDAAWVSSLSSLRHLDLRDVDLGGARNIDKLLNIIPSLVHVCLSECSLSNAQLLPFHLNSSITLSKIQHLDLSLNSFEGPFPSFLHNMTSLEFLDLSGYNLSNQPESFRNLLNMFPTCSGLYLSYCGLLNTHLSLTHVNFSTLSKIQHLDLSENSFDGEFPSLLSKMSSLRILDLSYNCLNSSIPVMKNLVHLDLHGNLFHRIEQTGIWNQCHLRSLDLSSNNFQEEIIGPSANVSPCVHFDLGVLDLSWNGFGGSIPKYLEKLTVLKILNLDFNKFEGPIPASLGKLTALQKLRLGWNQLTGEIPDSLGKLTELEELSLSSNQLTGSVPFSLAQLTRLRLLDISNNSLQGSIFETHFANLSLLEYLDLTSNLMLKFNVSPEWEPPFQLRYLLLGSCKIASEFPLWIQTQKKLRELGLSKVGISGALPWWLQDIPITSKLDLSHNFIDGPLTNLPYQLESLLIQNNLFSGPIPKSVCKMRSITYLDISRNRLTGELPRCLEKLQDLRIMIVSSNMLSGVIPKLPSDLTWLQLNNNTFHGELPLSMGNYTGLVFLDLGENKFFGNIPGWLGEKFTALEVLRLHKNNFRGSIPEKLCQNSNLQILDFGYNGLTGSIPRCFGYFFGMVTPSFGLFREFEHTMTEAMKGTTLEYTTNIQYVVNMDLSSNNLVGEIPEELASLSGLVGLNLSHNNLSGEIPNRIGDMTSLNSLDLSANQLSGVIPRSLANLSYLSYLNLSQNDLSGRIPTGNQLQTLNDPSIYAGNRELCGTPLPKDCSNHEDSATRNDSKEEKVGDEPEKLWLSLDIISGFATGFWGIIGVLLSKKHWRQLLFRSVEASLDKIYVLIAVRVSMLRRG